jgi:hypothetical protein
MVTGFSVAAVYAVGILRGPMVAGGEVEVAPVITGTVGRMGLPATFETAARPGDRVPAPVRPAEA